MERGMNLGNISYADRCIAHNDELSIENELIGLKGLGAEWALKTAGECADALRRIDALKFSGEYENERARLKAIIEDNTPQETKERDKVFQEKIAAWSNSLEFSDFRKHYSNFLAGCQSPDGGVSKSCWRGGLKRAAALAHQGRSGPRCSGRHAIGRRLQGSLTRVRRRVA